jgi:hypothetical protein
MNTRERWSKLHFSRDDFLSGWEIGEWRKGFAGSDDVGSIEASCLRTDFPTSLKPSSVMGWLQSTPTQTRVCVIADRR